MANWYSGVLKYVDKRSFHVSILISCSTGKRRYGHPALNGVLPQPWLPLKKGQTLVNRDRANGPRPGDAVVLTMRRRWSAAPRGSRIRKRSTIPLTDAPRGYGTASGASGDANPWVDASSTRRSGERDALLQHRLSFDDASGVIMLPDDGAWLMEDVGSDSDSEDYGTLSSVPGTTTEQAAPPADGGAHSDPELLDEPGPAMSPPTSPTRKRRQTYFHHPERRRQSIPGAFPGPSAPQ
jgi:hypothetical protein